VCRSFLCLLLAASAASSLHAQAARFEVVLPPAERRGGEPPAIRSDNLLAEEQMRQLLRSGFPAHLHYRLEMWQAGGLLDHLRGQAEWDVLVRYNNLDKRFSAVRYEGERAENRTTLGSFDQLRDVEEAVGRAYQPLIRLPRPGERYYYSATLRIVMLSVSDLDEVGRWLRGELGPAVKGERSPGKALGQGARTLVARLLGGEERQYDARTPIFRAPTAADATRD